MLETFPSPRTLNTPMRGPLAPQRSVTRSAALAEGKIALPHRFYLVDGRVIEGFLFRGANSRLVDELYGQKGSFVSVVDACCVDTGETVPYMAINERHIVSIEEMAETPPLQPRTPSPLDGGREPEG